jgi:hypothetical protein
VPAAIYEQGLRERGDELKPMTAEQAYLFSRSLKFTTCHKAHALVRYTNPDGARAGWWFYHPELYRFEGEKLAVYFDEKHPQGGATVVPIRPGAKPVPMACEFVDGTPQFALGLDFECGRGATAAVDALERRKALMIARVSDVRDGAGSSATVEHKDYSGTMPRAAADPRGPKPIRDVAMPTTRGTAPSLSSNPDYMRRLEEQFAAVNPGVAAT